METCSCKPSSLRRIDFGLMDSPRWKVGDSPPPLEAQRIRHQRSVDGLVQGLFRFKLNIAVNSALTRSTRYSESRMVTASGFPAMA